MNSETSKRSEDFSSQFVDWAYKHDVPLYDLREFVSDFSDVLLCLYSKRDTFESQFFIILTDYERYKESLEPENIATDVMYMYENLTLHISLEMKRMAVFDTQQLASFCTQLKKWVDDKQSMHTAVSAMSSFLDMEFKSQPEKPGWEGCHPYEFYIRINDKDWSTPSVRSSFKGVYRTGGSFSGFSKEPLFVHPFVAVEW